MLNHKDAQLAQLIFRLLKQATSQQLVKNFLKEKNIPTSALNWDDLFAKRIEPALNESKITIDELRSLLKDVEEFGRQHTFLFRCPPETAKKIISRVRIEKIAEEQKLTSLLTTPLDLELPEDPTLVDIRIIQPDKNQPPTGLVIKMVETRITKVLLAETTDFDAGRMTKTYSVSRKRAVNIAHLDANGLLELRIASRDNQSRYLDNLKALQVKISKFIPRDGFAPVSLSTAKDKLLNNRKMLANEIRYSHSSARNDFGFVMNVSSSSQEENLSTDDGSMAALDSFLANEGHVTGTNIYVKIPDAEPQREIHILLSGEVNEFAVPIWCSSGDYAYVRGKILTLNQ